MSPYYFPRRYLFLLLSSLSVIISYADRSNISIAIIPMAEEFGYSKERQGFILSSFFYGYLMTQVLGGYLSFRFGGKLVLAIGATVWSVFTIVTAWTGEKSIGFLIFCRIALGLGEGLGFPAIHSMISAWIPPSEQGFAVSVVTAASYFGSILAYMISSPLSNAFGWRSIFYVFGIMGFAWNVPWYFFGASTPEQSKGISNLELHHINVQKKMYVGLKRSDEFCANDSKDSDEEKDESDEAVLFNSSNNNKKMLYGSNPTEKESDENISTESQSQIPWLKILKSKEVWAILINQFCNSWGFYVLLTWLPTYYKDVYNVDISSVGYFTMLPYFVQGVVGLLSGVLGDFMSVKMKLSTHMIRQLAQCTGMLGTALFLLIGAYSAKSAIGGSLCITVALGLNALTLIGVSVSPHDIAPKYAGIIFGLGNTAATLPGILGVYISGVFLQNGNHWDFVFGLAAIFYVLGTISWIFMAGGNKVVIH